MTAEYRIHVYHSGVDAGLIEVTVYAASADEATEKALTLVPPMTEKGLVRIQSVTEIREAE